MPLGLTAVLLESSLQIFVLRRFHHLRQHGQDFLLGEVDVFERVMK